MSNLWRPWDAGQDEVVRPNTHDTGAQRKRVTIGEPERRFIVQCYNTCHGKDWQEVLQFVKQRVLEAGLPDHIVNMYLDQTTERLTARMRNIIKNALRLPQPATSTGIDESATSTGIDETPALIAKQTTYSTRLTPSQRKAEAVKRKLDNEFVASSSESGGEDGGREEKKDKKRKIDHAKQAQLAHKKMCDKAMDTMAGVNELLAKVDSYLDKANK